VKSVRFDEHSAAAVSEYDHYHVQFCPGSIGTLFRFSNHNEHRCRRQNADTLTASEVSKRTSVQNVRGTFLSSSTAPDPLESFSGVQNDGHVGASERHYCVLATTTLAFYRFLGRASGSIGTSQSLPKRPKATITQGLSGQTCTLRQQKSHCNFSLLRRNVRQRRNPSIASEASELTSIQELLEEVNSGVHQGLSEIVRSNTFVGMADETFALLQHKTKLFLANVVKLRCVLSFSFSFLLLLSSFFFFSDLLFFFFSSAPSSSSSSFFLRLLLLLFLFLSGFFSKINGSIVKGECALLKWMLSV
jgi:hypothetical protein